MLLSLGVAAEQIVDTHIPRHLNFRGVGVCRAALASTGEGLLQGRLATLYKINDGGSSSHSS